MTGCRTALVLGLGESGRAAARLLSVEGAKVTAVDSREDDALRETAEKLRSDGAEVILNCVKLPDCGFDVCVISPGVSCDSEWVKSLQLSDVKIISELELGASRCKCPMIAITGSKGKSTVAKICGEGLVRGGYRAEICGNYGLPICDAALRSEKLDWVVVEVSSFQMEFADKFSPHIGVLLNVQPDHLDRHITMDRYRSLKAKIFGVMTDDDIGIVVDGEIDGIRRISGGKNRWVSFGADTGTDYAYSESAVKWMNQGVVGKVSVLGTMFDNEIMGFTAAASSAVLSHCGLDSVVIEETLRKYVPLPHRMENVAEKRGVKFVNDSKATNLAAMAAGVLMIGRGVRLIAGGQLKEKDLNSVKEVLVKKVKAVYIIGESTKEMLSAWGGVVDCRQCNDLATAVRAAYSDAIDGDVVLLSPGCASFDQFKNYKDRGNQFKQIVKEEVGEL